MNDFRAFVTFGRMYFGRLLHSGEWNLGVCYIRANGIRANVIEAMRYMLRGEE